MTSATKTMRELAPHWAVMFLVMMLGLGAVDRYLGDAGLLPALALATVVAFGYPALLRRFGLAPPAWQR
ncbi:hypothetical protein GJ633_04405 [Halorubrum sp. CBA1125]|uniref:hypothetical protein n=1 Tax=Halorubrum sp. CBA1125 TaxID=2668072 RepID=UPI0012E91A03|nr:hypothetical protein [Halorubrum sp. CBA1125]MUW13990.1 hypothetical protein [Halorubrum sp. CBA1125]